MEGNPFEPLNSVVSSASLIGAERKLGGYLVEVFHNIIRGLLTFFYFGIAPIFVVPAFSKMFEEHEIELPGYSILVLQFSRLTIRYWYVLLPLSICLFAGIEFAILKGLSGIAKLSVNILCWLVLLLIAGIAFLGIWMPCQII